MKTSPLLLAGSLHHELTNAIRAARVRIVTIGVARELVAHTPHYDPSTGEITIGVEVDALVAEPPPLGDLAGLPDPETARAQAVATAEAGHPMKGAVDDMLATMMDVARTAANPEPLVIIGQGDGARHINP